MKLRKKLGRQRRFKVLFYYSVMFIEFVKTFKIFEINIAIQRNNVSTKIKIARGSGNKLYFRPGRALAIQLGNDA